ncbi:MAG: S-layer protein [Candidatus Micrarchaeota archaeon]
MKGLSVKKIAALAAGAAILGASVVAADVTYGNTQIVNQNGQPVVKVVVGQKAAASDGVVAANIAAKIGNYAYSKQTLSATLSGTATCTTSLVGGGVGSCPVSNEKVVLEVTLPGVVSGSASFKTYINDYVDKYTEDRYRSPSGVGNNYSTSTEIKPCFTGSPTAQGSHVSSTSAEVADPNTGCEHGRKISGGDFPPMATATVRDTYAGRTYTEEQSLWVYGTTEYDETLKTVVANTPNVAYKVDFTHDLYGVPISTCTNYGASTCVNADLTERHRVAIKYLGEDWIISDMTAPAMVGYNTTSFVATRGSSGVNSISLAKESAYGIVHIGENLTAGAYAIKLADIGLATGAGNEHAAAIEIFDANGVLVKEDQIFESSGTYSWTAPDGSKLKIRVYQTQPGYTLASKWAEMAVYSNEITLTDNGAEIDKIDNPGWYAYMYWSFDPNNNNVTTLKSMVLRKDPNTAVTLKMQKGDSISVITTPAKFQLTYDGLNLGSADYDTMSLQIAQYGLAVSATNNCASTTNLGSNNYLMYVVTGLTNGFTVNGVPTNHFYVDLSGVNSTNGTYVYYQQSGQSCYFRMAAATSTVAATYNTGDGVTQSLTLQQVTTGSSANVSMRLTERASTTTADTNSWQFELDNGTGGAWTFTGSATQSKTRYVPTGLAKMSGVTSKMVEAGYTSERGSVFNSLTSTAAVLKVAKKVGEASYYISTVGAAPSGATEITLAEGEEQTLAGGVVIKAKEITETVGACTSTGGEGDCSIDMSPVSAVLNTGDDSVDVIVPYKMSGKLVVMDNEASGAAVVISVGGPVVNVVTEQALGADSSLLSKPGDVVVKEVGNTIVVAGFTGGDTITAGDQFINGLQVG